MSVAMWNCHSWPLDVSSSVKLPVLRTLCYHRGVYLTACMGTSSHISSLSLHLTSSFWGWYIWQPIWAHYLTSDLGHFIWQVVGGISGSLSGYIISYLILVTSSDNLWWWGGISEHFIWKLDCFEWALIDNIDQWRTLPSGTGSFVWGVVDLPNLNSSSPQDASTRGVDLPVDLPIWTLTAEMWICYSWPLDVSTGGDLPIWTLNTHITC